VDLITVSDAARELGISREAVYKAIREGRLPAIKILGKVGIERKILREYHPVEVRVRAGKKRAAQKRKSRGGK
jgi:excisionase family DNA binding protein